MWIKKKNKKKKKRMEKRQPETIWCQMFFCMLWKKKEMWLKKKFKKMDILVSSPGNIKNLLIELLKFWNIKNN